jgi:hypothetical protein
MSVSALAPNHIGRSVYITPQQSPRALDVHDPFANPEGLDDIDEKIISKDEKPLTNSILPHRDEAKVTPVLNTPPEVPPRPEGRVAPEATATKKTPPQLPARPPSQPSNRLPKPTPSLPTRGAPSPLRQRYTLPPPTINEDASESREGGYRPLKYTRDPHSLIAYLIPLPRPKLSKNTDKEEALPEVCGD